MQNIFVPIIFLRKGSRNEGVLCACFSLKVKKLDQFTTDFYMWYMVKNCHYQLDCLKVGYEALWEVRSLQILPFHLYFHVFLICFSKPKPFPQRIHFTRKKTLFSNHTDIQFNPLTLVLMGKDGGLSTLCHGCRFTCQTVLKRFPGPGCLRSEKVQSDDGIYC